MEKNINIAEILAKKPKGTKLYDILYNREVELDNVSTTGEDTSIWCISKPKENETVHYGYSKFGTLRGHEDGLQILKPSKQMRDWEKFAWKKGDVLENEDKSVYIIFDRFEEDTYDTFKGVHYLFMANGEVETFQEKEGRFLTNLFSKADNIVVCGYINTIEERLGGKLNLETLEIVSDKPKWTPNPFDKVVVRDSDNANWIIDFFNYYNDTFKVYVGLHNASYKYCIPYNEETAKLIGTTDDYKED